eukprot:514828_1
MHSQYDSDEDCELIEDAPITTKLDCSETNPRKRSFKEMEITTKTSDEPLTKKQRLSCDISNGKIKSCGYCPWKHWNVYPGVNYYGIVNHLGNCAAFNQKVSVCRGFGNINVIKDLNIRKCPSCSQNIMLEGIVLFKCKANVKYKIENTSTNLIEK